MDGKTKRGFSRIKKLLLCVSSDLEPTSPIQRANGPTIPLISSQLAHALLQPGSAPLMMPSPDLEVHKNSQRSSPAPILLTSLAPEQITEYEGWAELKTFASLLSKCAAMFGPLKQVVDGIVACVETFESVGKNREDYQKLKVKLNTLFHDLPGYFGESAPPGMRSSVADLAEGIKQELKIVQQKQRECGIGSYIKVKRDADEVWLCYHRIQGLFERFMVNANVSTWKIVAEQTMEAHLKSLPNSPDAMYRSAKSSSLRGRCTSNTRIQVLEQLHDWACDDKSEKICWLNGMAGTGKTTIAYSVCERLKDAQKLAASFFCSRQLPKCRDVNRIVPSISYQLSRFSRPFRYAVSRVLEENPEVHNQLLPDQFRQLILEPLKQVKDSLPADLVIVVDALDECDDNNDVDRILDVLLSNAQELPVKFFVTSRPEPKILDRMRNQEGEGIHTELRLHELEHQSVQEDIRTFLQTKLGARIDIPADDLDTLVKRSGVLFIYAATVVRHIEEDNFAWATTRLEEVLSMADSSSDDIYGKVNELYTGILEAAFHGSKRSEQEKMKRIMHTVACAQEPLSVDVLAGLLGLDGKTSVRPALRLLRSILQLSDTTHIVTTLHDSFPNYLFDKNLSGPFYCDAREHNALLAQYCIEQLKIPSPPFNICNLDSSFVFDKDVPDLPTRVEKAISNVLFYSCRYWGAHLVSAKDSKDLTDVLFDFLSERLLLWMEVMNLKRCIHDGTRTLYQVQKWSQSANWQDETIKQLLRDAWMFTTSFSSSPAMFCTPHIYVSTLTFWPNDSPITKYYQRRRPRLISRASTAMSARRTTPLVIMNTGRLIKSLAYSSDGANIIAGSYDETIRTWDAHTGQPVGQPLQGRTESVTPVACSPNGAHVVSGSDDNTLRICDTRTGQLVGRPLQGHTKLISSVAYSPDGEHIVSGSHDNTLRIWNAHTGQPIGQPLQGHTQLVTSVVYSPDGAYIASGSHDKTIRIWDAHAGQPMGHEPLQGHTQLVTSAVYSPDGANVASSSYDKTICIWNARTSQLIGQPLQGHSQLVTSVAYSPDSAYIVSGSHDETIRIWDACSGRPIGQPLQGHTRSVTSVAYSPGGACIVSGSHDKTIRIWDAYTGQPIGQPLQGHTRSVSSVAYSPDGAYVASGSYDRTIRIWDAQTGQPVGQPLQGHTLFVTSVAYSPNGEYITSGSHDRTVRIWDAHIGQPRGQPLRGHTWFITSVAYSPNGAYIVSGSDDKTIRIWDARTGQCIGQPLQGHTESISSVAYSPDGASVISGSHDNTVRIWDTQSSAVRGNTPQLENNPAQTIDALRINYAWTIDDDGWVVTGDSKLLVWVPHDLRLVLLRLHNVAVLSRHGFLQLDFCHTRIGEHWREHFQPEKRRVTAEIIV